MSIKKEVLKRPLKGVKKRPSRMVWKQVEIQHPKNANFDGCYEYVLRVPFGWLFRVDRPTLVQTGIMVQDGLAFREIESQSIDHRTSTCFIFDPLHLTRWEYVEGDS